MNAIKAVYKAWLSSIVGSVLIIFSVSGFFFNFPQVMLFWEAAAAFLMGMALLFTDPKEVVLKFVDAFVKKKVP